MKIVTSFYRFTFGSHEHFVYYCSKGEGLPRHDHLFPHITICHAGKIVVRKEGIEKEFTAISGAVLLKENEWHEIEALEDETVFENINNALVI